MDRSAVMTYACWGGIACLAVGAFVRQCLEERAWKKDERWAASRLGGFSTTGLIERDFVQADADDDCEFVGWHELDVLADFRTAAAWLGDLEETASDIAHLNEFHAEDWRVTS